MPQEFHVLRCYCCGTFQVHIVKKSNKWECKMCGEKQSIKKVYGKGTGKECRLHVQSLNETRVMDESVARGLSDSEDININEDIRRCDSCPDKVNQGSSKTSKWAEYLEEVKATVDVSEDNSNYTFERHKKRKFPQQNISAINNKDKEPLKRLKMQHNGNRDQILDESNTVDDYSLPRKKICKNMTENNTTKKYINSKWSNFVSSNDANTA